MSKRHTVTLHHVRTVHNAMFDHLDGVIQSFHKKKTQWKEDLYFAAKFARRKLSTYYAEVTPQAGILVISAHILNPFRKLRSFSNWDIGKDINLEDETSYSTQNHEALLKNVENEYCGKHRCLHIIKRDSVQSNHLIPSPMPSGCGQASFDPNDLSSSNEEYIKPQNAAANLHPEKKNYRAERLTNAASLLWNVPPGSQKQWRQINLNLNNYL